MTRGLAQPQKDTLLFRCNYAEVCCASPVSMIILGVRYFDARWSLSVATVWSLHLALQVLCMVTLTYIPINDRLYQELRHTGLLKQLRTSLI